MQSVLQPRNVRNLGTAPSARGSAGTPIPAIRRLSLTSWQHSVLLPGLLRHERRQSCLHATQKDTFDSVSSQATIDTKRKGTNRSQPADSVSRDLTFIPNAPEYSVGLRLAGIDSATAFYEAYCNHKTDFRGYLQDKIMVVKEKHITEMVEFAKMLDRMATLHARPAPAAAQEVTAASATSDRAWAQVAATAAAVGAQIAPVGHTTTQVTLSVEGNISAGKSTFLSILHRHLLDGQGFSFIKEPIEQWQSVGGSVNLLELFYKDPARMAYTFQNFVFLTRVLQERETYGGSARARILERSVFSDRMVFVRAVRSSGDLAHHELAIYDAWFGPVLASLPTLVPNGIIYLRASPETCMARLRKRARSEEVAIPLEYLQSLHRNHEDWLVDACTPAVELQDRLRQQQQAQQGGQDPVARQPAQQQQREEQVCSAAAGAKRCALPDPAALRPLAEAPPGALAHVEVPASLADHLFIIDATKVHGVPSAPFLHGLPALRVDCEADVDVEGGTQGGLAHGEAVSNMIRDYTTFVSDYRAACRQLADAHAHAQRQSQPHASASHGHARVHLPAGEADYYVTDPASGRVTYRSASAAGLPGAAHGVASERQAARERQGQGQQA